MPAKSKPAAAEAEHPRLGKLTPICLRLPEAERTLSGSHATFRMRGKVFGTYIGARGGFGLRLDRGAVDWDEVANVVELSYRFVAPKTLARKLDP